MFVIVFSPTLRVVGPFTNETEADSYIKKNEPRYLKTGGGYYVTTRRGLNSGQTITILPLLPPR